MHDGKDLRELADALRSASRRGQGRPYPARLRERVVAAVDDLVASGESSMQVARALGLPYRTIDRWRRQERPTFRAVVVSDSDASRGGLVLHGPLGLRVEGLDVDSLADLLRRLS